MFRYLKPRAEIPRAARWGGAVFGFLLLLASWHFVSQSYRENGDSVLMPAPSDVFNAGLDYFGHGDDAERIRSSYTDTQEAREAVAASAASQREILAGDVWISFRRVTYGFILAVIVALPLGVLMGAFRLFESVLQPLTEFIRFVPVPALTPLLIVFFGIDEMPKVMLIFIGTVFQLMLMVADEIRRVPDDLVNTCYTLGGTRTEVVGRIMLPAAMPGIFDAMRMCNGWAWTWLIVAELVASNQGMGFRIIRYQRFLQTDNIFLYLIILGFIGLLLDFVFRLVGRWLFKWTAHTES